MRCFVFVFVLLFVPGWLVADETEILVWSSVAADLATTEIGLYRGGVSEANPLVRNRGARVAMSVGTAALVHFLYRKKLLPKWGALGFAGAHFGAAGWNVALTLRF